MNWKEEVKQIVEKGCTDSDIEDYIEEHSNVNGKEIWNYVSELDALSECKGCKYIQMTGMNPCICCSRRVKLKDYYEAR